MRILLAVSIALILMGSAQGQSPPSFAAPKDLGAGFDPKLLGEPPKPVPGEAPILEALHAEPKFWSGGAELGLAGTSGNANVLKVRTGLNVKRTTDRNVFSVDFLYGLSELNSRVTENKALLLVRDEMKLGTSKWSVFIADTVEYDQFRAFDFREAVHAGIGRTWIKNPRTTFKTRFGAGVSYELNTATVASRWVPEGQFGFDWDFQITERQKIVTTLDYFPDFGNFRQFRVRARAAYEILLDPRYGLVLRLGVQDRYDSRSGPGIARNDIDYFSTLMLKF